MQKKTVASRKAAQKTRGIPSEPLTVTLDSEASKIVRAWADILQRDPADVASGMMLYMPAETLESYREKTREGHELTDEGYLEAEKLIREAQKRRTARETEELARIRTALNAPHMAAVARRISVEFPADISYALKRFAEIAYVSPAALAATIMRTELEALDNDPAVLVPTVDAARELQRTLA